VWHAWNAEGRHTINRYKYQVEDGACTDSFYTPNFEKLYESPFGDLQQKYLECLSLPFDAANIAAGVAAGTAGLLTSFAFLFLTTLLFEISKIIRSGEQNEERKDVKRDVDEVECVVINYDELSGKIAHIIYVT
jgi:hypothetical protein